MLRSQTSRHVAIKTCVTLLLRNQQSPVLVLHLHCCVKSLDALATFCKPGPCTATPEQGLDTRTGVQSFVTIALGLSKLPDLHEMHAIIYPDISAGQYK